MTLPAGVGATVEEGATTPTVAFCLIFARCLLTSEIERTDLEIVQLRF